MSLEGSESAAEMRMNQLLGRIDDMTAGSSMQPAQKPSADQHSYYSQPGQVNPKQFKAIASMMQARMFSESFAKPGDNSSDPFAGMMGGMMNPMMMGMGAMPGMMPGNPMAMMGGMMNPMMMGMQQAMPQKAMFPLEGQISSEYGEREHPIHGHHHFHEGLDIAAEKGSAIKMPWDGKVTYVGHVDGFGENTVIVAHENQRQPDGKIVYSIFGHNEYAFVKAGDNVHQGDIFATVGDDGDSTGTHLHWETRIAPQGLGGLDIFNKKLSYSVDPVKLIV